MVELYQHSREALVAPGDRMVVGLGAFTTMTVMSVTLWNVTPCSMARVDQIFSRAHCLYLQDRRVSQASNQQGNLMLASIELGRSRNAPTYFIL
jgi:hypothetical protein